MLGLEHVGLVKADASVALVLLNDDLHVQRVLRRITSVG
jgi:hypothetical protein